MAGNATPAMQALALALVQHLNGPQPRPVGGGRGGPGFGFGHFPPGGMYDQAMQGGSFGLMGGSVGHRIGGGGFPRPHGPNLRVPFPDYQQARQGGQRGYLTPGPRLAGGGGGRPPRVPTIPYLG